MASIKTRIPASKRLISASSPLTIIIKRTILAMRANGISLRTVVFGMVIGATIAAHPTISMELKMLLPTTLPTAKSDVPLIAETNDTQNSGMDVPKATIVKPMTI